MIVERLTFHGAFIEAGADSYRLGHIAAVGHWVRVVELVPPWVATGLVGDEGDERAMPVDDFTRQALEQFERGHEEIVVDLARIYRDNAGPDEHGYVHQLNLAMTETLAA